MLQQSLPFEQVVFACAGILVGLAAFMSLGARHRERACIRWWALALLAMAANFAASGLLQESGRELSPLIDSTGNGLAALLFMIGASRYRLQTFPTLWYAGFIIFLLSGTAATSFTPEIGPPVLQTVAAIASLCTALILMRQHLIKADGRFEFAVGMIFLGAFIVRTAEAASLYAPLDSALVMADVSITIAMATGLSILANRATLTPEMETLAQLAASEAQLRASRQRFSDIAEVSGDWIWEADAQQRFTFISERLTRVTGIEPATVLGKTRADFASRTSDPESWAKHEADIRARRPFRNFVYAWVDKDGRRRHFRVSGKPVFNEAGRFCGYRGTGTDITAEIEARKAAHLIERRMSDAMETLPHGTAIFDANDRLAYYNERYREAFSELADLLVPGAIFEDLVREAARRGVFQPDGQSLAAFVEERLGRHRTPPTEPSVTRLSGGRWSQLMERETSEGGRLIAWTDITALKRRERALSILVGSRGGGEQSLRAAVRALAEAVGYRWTAICRRVGEDRAQILDAWSGNGKEGLRPGVYALAGTPCALLAGSDEFLHVRQGVAARFPQDEMLAELGAESYLGQALNDSEGRVIGHVMALDDRPDLDQCPARDLVSLIAAWISIELERRAAERALQESETRYRDFVESASDWSWECDAELRLSWISPRMTELTRIPVAEMLGRRRWEIEGLDPDTDEWADHIAQLEAGEPFYDFRFSFRYQGKLHHHRVSGRPIFDEKLRFVGYRGLEGDETERMQAQVERERTLELLEAVFDHMAEGVAVVDPRDRLIAFNRRFLELFDLSTDHMRPRDLIAPHFSETLENAVSQQGIAAEVADSRLLPGSHDDPQQLEITGSAGKAIELRSMPLPGGGYVATYADITERKMSDLALRPSEQRFRDFASISADWFWETDLEQRFTYLSGRMPTITGQKELKRLLGQSRPSYLKSLGVTDKPVAEIAAHMAEGKSFRDVEFQWLDDKGREFYIRLAGQPYMDDNGQIVGYRGVGREVTESRRVEHALRENEHRYRQISELASDLVYSYRLDPTGRMTLEWAAGSLADLDVRPAEHGYDLGGWIESVLPDDRRILEHSADRLREGHHSIDEFRVRSRSGEIYWLRVFVRPDLDPDSDRVRRIIGAAQDITESKRAEEALMKSEERYALAMAGANEGLWEWTIERGEIYISPRLKSIAHLEVEGLKIRHHVWRRKILREDRSRYQKALLEHLRGETPFYSCEYRIRGDDGEVRWVSDRGLAQRDPAGNLTRIAGSLGDITQRRQQEAELRRAMEETELANRTKSEFLANMSHELRTPLNAIIGFAEIMKGQMLGPIGDERYLNYTDDIRESGTHLLNIINDILDVSKAEAGVIELEEEPVDLGHLVRSCMRIMRPRAINTHVTLQTDVPASLPKLRGDERRLKQILINLLSNAVKFSQQGGVVRVAVRFEEDASLAIEVSDDGIGIAREHLDRIFEPFAQVDSTISRRHDGTGLGLPLTRALTECHGGTLTIESQPQEGTTVTVRLPAERILANEAA